MGAGSGVDKVASCVARPVSAVGRRGLVGAGLGPRFWTAPERPAGGKPGMDGLDCTECTLRGMGDCRICLVCNGLYRGNGPRDRAESAERAGLRIARPSDGICGETRGGLVWSIPRTILAGAVAGGRIAPAGDD